MSENNSNVHSTSPDSYVVVFPYEKERTSIGSIFKSDDLKTKRVVMDADIISVQTSKGKGGSGSWSVTLSSSKNYKAILHTGCWAAIYINDTPYSSEQKESDSSSSESGLKMIGIVKSLRVDESTGNNGVRTIRYQLSGEDFHTLFNNKIYISSLFRIPDSTGVAGLNSAYYIFGDDFKDAQKKLNPGEIADLFLNAALSKAVSSRSVPSASAGVDKDAALGGTMGMPPAVATIFNLTPNKNNNFNDSIKRLIQKNMIGAVIIQPSIGDQFTIWSLIKSYTNPICNEIYTDLVVQDKKLVPAFVCRSIPFGTKKGSFVAGPDSGHPMQKTIHDSDESIGLVVSKDIKEHEIINLNYGKSDGERFNFFYISTSLSRNKDVLSDRMVNLVAGGKLSNIGDSVSIARYGLRPYITSSEFILDVQDHAKDINRVVRDMWATAHFYENGQVTIVGSHEHIPVGSNITFGERKWIAHVEGVSHQYSVGGDGMKSFTTTITFVRLQTKKGNPIDLVEGLGTSQRPFDRGVTHSEGGEE